MNARWVVWRDGGSAVEGWSGKDERGTPILLCRELYPSRAMAGEKKRQRGEKKSSPVVRLPLAGGEEVYSLNASKVGSVAKVKTLFI
jgi:hypothetical protein